MAQQNLHSSFMPTKDSEAPDVLDVLNLVDSELADDPNAAHKALSLMSNDEALAFYKERCAVVGVKPNNTFTRLLQSEVSLINFANSYFGERGMQAVAPTLQRIPVISLDLSNTGLSFEDVGLLQEALATHPTLTSIDLSANPISMPSARRLLSLAIQNKRITNIALDESVPKHILIKRHCLANANVCVYASSCVVCQKSMIHSEIQGVETHILLRVAERLGPRLNELCGVEFECIWRCLIASVDINDGVLFVCSPDCIQALADDVVAALYFVMGECIPDVARQHRPKNMVLSRCAVDFAARLQKDRPDPSHFEAFIGPSEVQESDWTTCSISGETGVRISKPHTAAMDILVKDLKAMGATSGMKLRPSAFSRLLHLMLRNAKMRPCSVKSIRMLVRFAIHGSGGALQARPQSDDVLLDSLATPMVLPPIDHDFAVVTFEKINILDQGEHDISCACAVATLMEDIDGLPLDPYFIFAAARHISRKTIGHLGVDLRAVCSAVQTHGCLEAKMAPFNRDTPRHIFADWRRWQELPNFDCIVKNAFSHRKTEFFLVSGPHENMFDNIRTALYAYRKERRGIVAVMKWRVEWMDAEHGIIPTEKFAGGFHTAVKVVGQTHIDHEMYLVIQPNFGRSVGNKGFFYAARSTINRSLRGGAFIFLNRRGVMEKTGMELPPPAYSGSVNPQVSQLLSSPTAVYDLLRFIHLPSHRTAAAGDVQRLQNILQGFPPSLLFAFFSRNTVSTQQERFHARSVMRLYSHQSNSQVAFLWNEVLSPDAVQWAVKAVESLQIIYDARNASDDAESKQRQYLLEKRGSLWADSAPHSPSKSIVAEMPDVDDDEERSESPKEEAQPSASAVIEPKPPKAEGGTNGDGKKNQAPRKSVAKQQEEAMIEKHKRLLDLAATTSKTAHEEMLTDIAEASRIEEERQDQQSRIFRRKTDFSWDPQRIGPPSSVSESPMYALQKRSSEFPLRFISKNWTTLLVPNDSGVPTRKAMMFIYDSVCCYDMEAAQATTPLLPIKGHPQFESFPFSHGFEAAAICRAVNPAEVYFFCEEHWMCWDLRRNACTRGPFNIHIHSLFRNLPEAFRARIDCVIDVTHKPQLLFISGPQYLIFDLKEQAVVEGGVHEAGSGPYSELFTCIPGSPMTALHQWAVGTNRADNDDVVSSKVYMCSTAGAAVFFDMQERKALEAPEAFSASPLANLPIPFLQATTVAFNALQATLINRLPKNKIANPVQFIPPTPPTGVIAPSTLAEGVSYSWKVSISTDFEVVVPADSAFGTINDIVEPINSAEGGQLLHNMVKLRQAEPFTERFIEFDAGSLNSYRFGYVQIALDVSSIDPHTLLSTPIAMQVEVSWDGIGYRPVAQTSLFGSFSDVWWPITHAARHWRLRFNNFPEHVSVIKVCWFTVHWVTDSPHYALAERYHPPESAKVTIEACTHHLPSDALLKDISSGPVYETCPSRSGFLAKHCVLPLLPPANSALFFIGNTFAEWDFVAQEVVGSRVLTFDKHPAFRKLPFPFNQGIDAGFYADPGKARTVVFVADGKVVEWHLEQGEAVGEVEKLEQSFWFAGLPENATSHGIDAIVNVWSRPGQIFIFSGPMVTRWSTHTHQLVDGPLPRDKFPLFDCEEFSNLSLLSAVSFPNQPNTAYLFHEDKFASVTWSADRKVIAKQAPVELGLSPELHRLSWYMKWGTRIANTSLLVDFVEETPLITGITMRSEDGCSPDTKWRVETSADGVEWTWLADHQQNAPKSCTMWDIDAVSIGKRYLRLTVIENTCPKAVSYHHLIFHHLPNAMLNILPSEVQTNGEVQGGELFSGGMLTFTKPSRSTPGHITVDYGVEAPPELTGVSFGTSSSINSDLWAVLYSDDGSTWTEVGAWRVRTATTTLCWAPAFPHRFWRVELRASLNSSGQTPFFKNWAFHEYTGPSFVSTDRKQYLRGLASLFPSLQSSSRLNVDCVVGSSLAFDFKGDPQALGGIGIYTEVDSLTFMTSFEVEYSDDTIDWFTVGTVLVCDDLGTTAWEHEGRHRYWRLRITQHYGGSILRFLRIEFFVSGPTLYTRHQRHVRKLAEGNVFADRDYVQGEFVACHAILPPKSRFVVERGAEDSITWVPVGVLMNADHHEKNVTCGWERSGASLQWRLRDITEELDYVPDAADSETKTAAQPIAPRPQPRRVTWSSFSGTRTHPANIYNRSGSISATGFTAIKNANLDLINNHDNAKPIVESDEGASMPTVTWTFDTRATFSEVEIVPSPIVEQPVRVNVEISEDGDKFIAIAGCTIPTPEGRRLPKASAFWNNVRRAKYWRLTFLITEYSPKVQLVGVRWYFRYGSPSLVAVPPLLSLSNPMHSDWQTPTGAVAAKKIRSFMAHAHSNALSYLNGFTDEDSLAPDDHLALSFEKHVKTVKKVITRTIKEQKGGSGRPSPNAPQFIDVCRVLEMFNATQTTELRALLESATLSDFKLLKDTQSWWMSKIEYKGTAVQPILGFIGSTCTLAIRWAISPPTLCNLTDAASAHHLDTSLAAATFTMNVTHQDWMANVNFPILAPLLYELAIAGKPITVCFASNRVDFVPDYPLTRPGSDPLTSDLLFSVHRGVNIMCNLQLNQCLCKYRLGLVAHFVGKKKFRRLAPVANIHAQNLNTAHAFLRFSVPTEGLTFGVEGLSVPSVNFEMRWDGNMGPLAFTANDAKWNIGGIEYDVSVAGQMNTDRPTATLRCECREGIIKNPDGLDGAILTDLHINAECLIVDDGFMPSIATVSGKLKVGALSLLATLSLNTVHTAKKGLYVQLMDTSFAEVAELCAVVTRAPLLNESWMAGKQLFTVTCSLELSPSQRCAKGVGSASFNGQSGVATVTATQTALKISCELPSANVGSIVVEGNPETGLTVDASTPSAEMGEENVPTIRIDGTSAIVTSAPTPCQIELSRFGTVCITNGLFFEALIRDDTFHPVVGDATINVPVSSFEEPIRRELLHSHIVSALAGAHVTFSFLLQSVSVDQCSIERKTMIMTFRGVLMGSGCEVMVTACCPDNTQDVVEQIAASAAAMMLEQCHEALWAAYDRFVGCRHQQEGGGGAFDSSPFNTPMQSLRVGTFLATWQDQDHVDIEEVIGNAIDSI